MSDDGSLSTITFDVTSVVNQWLGGSLANNGFILTQDNAGSQSLSFNALGAGGGAPLLTINTVPEPSSLVLTCLALGTIAIRAVHHCRRRARGDE